MYSPGSAASEDVLLPVQLTTVGPEPECVQRCTTVPWAVCTWIQHLPVYLPAHPDGEAQVALALDRRALHHKGLAHLWVGGCDDARTRRLRSEVTPCGDTATTRML